MNFLANTLSLFKIPRDKPALARAQMAILSRQIPLMYSIVLINTLALAYTHFPHAPLYLSVYIPAAMLSLSTWRTIVLLRDDLETDIVKIYTQLREVLVTAMVFGVVFSGWSLSLYQYGTPYTQGQIAFFIGITSLGCVVCLLHFRAAALALAISIIGPFAIFFVMTGVPVFAAIALNMLLVGGAVVFVLSDVYHGFSEAVDDREVLLEKQKETQKLSDMNSRLANLDSLTGLPNRRGFFAELGRRLESVKHAPHGLAVGVLDLDGFKPINDIYGHPMGDRLLVSVGHRLVDMLGSGVFVARMGGDEFGLIIEGDLSNEELIIEGNRICECMRVSFDMDGFMAQMTGSLGLAQRIDAADTASTMFERADYALYHAKDHLSGEAILFSEDHAETIRQVNGIERRLRDADFDDEMSLAFQPIIDIKQQKVAGFEVLARWHNPVLGDIPPATFIRAAERAGVINRLTEILFKKALVAAQSWPDDIFLSFNLSPYDINAPECIMRLASMFERSGFPAHRLTFEVTETALMQDFGRACETLQCLKNIGASIALDDFGTGYSSLSYVRQLPLDRLKVDRSFVTELEHDATARSVMRSVVDLCRNLDFECIIEGVETEGQLKILEEMGCDLIQGYLFSRPMEEALVGKYLAAEQKMQVSV